MEKVTVGFGAVLFLALGFGLCAGSFLGFLAIIFLPAVILGLAYAEAGNGR